MDLMQFHQTHIVNVTMALKYPALVTYFQDQGGEEILEKAIQDLTRFHGVVTGAVNGDEHLAGNDPARGAELCSIAEYMFSLEMSLEIFGDPKYGDLLERLAYNAYPAMFSEDYTGHQYLQQANQIRATNEERPWFNNEKDSIHTAWSPTSDAVRRICIRLGRSLCKVSGTKKGIRLFLWCLHLAGCVQARARK